jgi:hypothetical protein
MRRIVVPGGPSFSLAAETSTIVPAGTNGGTVLGRVPAQGRDDGAMGPQRGPAIARIAVILLMWLLGIGQALAQPVTSATDLAGLFVRGCLPFAGDPDRLRGWAAGIPLPVVPEPARSAFLNGAPGQVFDATTPSGKFVLVSSDDGLCSCITNETTGAAVWAALEASLRQIGLGFQLVIERDDKRATDLHYREYVANRDGQTWRILAATVNGAKGGQAMLTAGR